MEVPDLVGLIRATYGPQEVAVVGVSWGVGAEHTSSYIADFGVESPILIDDAGATPGCWQLPDKETSLFELFHYRYGDPVSEGPFPLEVIISPDRSLVYISRTYEPNVVMATLDSLLTP